SLEDEGAFTHPSRSVTSVRIAILFANSGVNIPLRRRHDQLPPGLLGMFMRASPGSPRTSCTGMTARIATEEKAARMKAQLMPSSAFPRYSSTERFSASFASLSHHPTVVLLSWVPV